MTLTRPRRLPPVATSGRDAADPGRRGHLTVASIARLAGVSAPTVSRVLNGRSGVRLDTRQRVEQVLREHRYRRPDQPSPAAIVEVVFSDVESQIAVEVMRGVSRVAREHRLAATFVEIPRRNIDDPSWADDLRARRPHGIITVHSDMGAERQAQFDTSAIPLVALDPTGESVHSVPSVGSTDWSGGIAAARHLYDLGHRRIAAISGPLAYMCARARLEGCRAALENAGAPIAPSLIRTGRFNFDDGRRFGRELLDLPEPPTAVVCGNDLQALGVYEAARLGGVRIPADLSVIGFDDLVYTRWCGPPMTSVRQPFADMGATAARMVLALAAGEELSQTRIELATTLVVRQSTAPPPRAAT
jgi:LacI family transcriptional regulator, xylobiose transport system transcriptional regulator